MDWWVIGLTAVGGAAALGWALTLDRRRARRAAQVAVSAPQRRIPTLPADAQPPVYVTEEEARTPRADTTTEDLEALSAAVAANDAVAGGWADAAFVTVPGAGWAVVHEPLVLVCTGVGSFRELLPAVELAKRSGRGLVVVAPYVEDAAVRTLVANAVQGHLACVAVTGADPAQAKGVAAAVGATVVPRSDLQSGWVPVASLGSCAVWVSSAKGSWALETLNGVPEPERSS